VGLSCFVSAASRLLVVSVLAVLAVLAVFGVFGVAPARAAGVRPPAYVALGDSYSAGVGAGGYDTTAGACKRSANAYPALWAAAHPRSSFAFTACSDAKTADVVHTQLGPVNSATNLISLTVGGNDAGFADVMATCLLSGTNACLNRVAQARGFVDKNLPRLLDSTYQAIHAKGPHAHVVVLGYPRIYHVPGNCLLGLSDTARGAINAAADDLDTVIAKRAADHGFTYTDVRAGFTGHELCSGAPWLHGVTLPLDESYHPTVAGQRSGYLPLFAAAA